MRSDAGNPIDAFELLLELSSKPEVTALQFATLDFAPLLEARSELSDADSAAVGRALELRQTLHLPFWDGVMLAGSHGEVIPMGALKGAVYHQELDSKVEWIRVEKLGIARLQRMSQKAQNEKRLLAVTSSVQVRDGSVKQLPLLDFHVGYSDHATRLIAEIMPLLGVSGALLRSGKSYHFYGESLVTDAELAAFLGRALLFAPIVDRAWIAHQLIEGCCALRISPHSELEGIPILIQYV